jgi:hypothetical protein
MKPKSIFIQRMSLLICSVCFLFTAPLFIIPFISEQFGARENWGLAGSGVSYILGILFFYLGNNFRDIKISIILGIAFPVITFGTFYSVYIVLDYYFSWALEALISAVIPLVIICVVLVRLLAYWLVRKYP